MKPFTTVAFAILVLVGLVHLLRLVTGFSLEVAGHAIPLWANALGAIIAFGVAFKLRQENAG
ncbi:MAG: hypothetical protein KGM49_12050 [Sphingomonadales bacterium]|nr:hypothetical protein [Sphingomonadales bacterium]